MVRIAAVLAACLTLAAPLAAQASDSSHPGNGSLADHVPATEPHIDVLAAGLVHPWGLAFLPDGTMVLTERIGHIRLVSPEGRVSPPLGGVPKVHTGSQAGLQDIALDPHFAQNHLVYVSFVEGDKKDGTVTAVGRGRLSDDRTALEDFQVIFRAYPRINWGDDNNYGSRIVFAPDGTLFATMGDRYDYKRNQLQSLANDFGKVIRINPDGTVPQDNPFVHRAGARPEIWAYGLRNPEGAAINPATHQLWTVEHGPKGGDEINIPEAGKNYGWPVITYGTDYDGSKIGIGDHKAGMEQPVHYWNPSIAPSGMAFYTGDLFPQWKGSLFVGALKAEMLVRLTLDGDKVTGEEHLLHKEVAQRIRDVRQGPDGALYLLTDDLKNGRLLRLTPASRQLSGAARR
jgi:glucose/arabinose dehydrogenase